jgi:hypothetical protein
MVGSAGGNPVTKLLGVGYGNYGTSHRTAGVSGNPVPDKERKIRE